MENYYIIHKNEDNNIIYTCFSSFNDFQQKIDYYHNNNIFHKIATKEEISTLKPIYSLAWEIVGSTIQINMPKARDIHRASLRFQRNKRLAPLDVAYMRALERADTTAAQEIAAQKQKLRDIPAHPAIEAAQTPDELIELTLDKLLTL